MPAHILVVDDNALNVLLLVHLLEINGYAVQSAPDADTALTLLAQQRPDLILLDMQMPGMDGYQLARKLRANPDTSGIPIFAVTAYTMPADRDKALAAGCDEHIPKPIDTRSFAAVVARFLANRAGGTGNASG